MVLALSGQVVPCRFETRGRPMQHPLLIVEGIVFFCFSSLKSLTTNLLWMLGNRICAKSKPFFFDLQTLEWNSKKV